MASIKRERLDPNPGSGRYSRRDARGRFTSDQTDVGRSVCGGPAPARIHAGETRSGRSR